MNINQAILNEMMSGHSPLSTAGRRISGWLLALLLVAMMAACAPIQPRTTAAPAPEENIGRVEVVSGAPQEALALENEKALETGGEMQTLPVRFQQPTFYINQMDRPGMDKDLVEPVGADIRTTSGPVPLLDIIKRLAALKNMNVSWASDVDQNVMTDVDIRADEDFFQAVDNLLRQVDYFYETQDNTLIIKYRETRKFHIAIPPRLTTISSSSNTGSAAVTSLSADTSKNRWDDVRQNLDQILDIWEETKAPAAAPELSVGEAAAAAPEPAVTSRSTGKGYYSINELIGLITVTAPRPLLAKIAEYVDDIKEELYRQVSIEAKIVEVQLNESSTTGLDWSGLLGNLDQFDIQFELFGGNTLTRGQIHPPAGEMAVSRITIPGTIDTVLDAIAEQGDIRVLSNPKVSVMNGQPAIIYVGDNLTYIDTVTTTVDEGVATTSVTTAQVTSGIRLEVYPTIISDDEIILSLTPMISGLIEDIQYETFGLGGQDRVGVPKVNERTMNSIVKIRNGQMLVIGGMIRKRDENSGKKVRLLGDLPVLNNLFKSKTKSLDSTEIVILLQPRII